MRDVPLPLPLPPQSCMGGALGIHRPMRLEDEMGQEDLGLDSPDLALPRRGSARQVVSVQSWGPPPLTSPWELEPHSEDQSVADSHRINY